MNPRVQDLLTALEQQRRALDALAVLFGRIDDALTGKLDECEKARKGDSNVAS